MFRFQNRQEAGRTLAAELGAYAAENPIILGLPRGGVPVAFEVARALSAPLDVWVVRKIGTPWHPELGMGAVAEGGYVYISRDIVEHVGISEEELSKATALKQREVEERVFKFRGKRSPPVLLDRTVVLVDDGIATGGTVRCAIRAIRAQNPRKIVLAVPVAAPQAIAELRAEVDDIICLLAPADLNAIGLWYQDFTQVPDEEVARLLEISDKELSGSQPLPRRHSGSIAR